MKIAGSTIRKRTSASKDDISENKAPQMPPQARRMPSEKPEVPAWQNAFGCDGKSLRGDGNAVSET